jgi:ribonuclease P protein component
MPSKLRFTFKKDERLSSRKLIEKTVAEGKSFLVHPFRLTWLIEKLPSDFHAQVVIVVPKKKFPRAVDRNRIKRQIREAYRKNKHVFYSSLKNKNIQCALMVVYVGKTILSSEEIEKKIQLTLQRFEENIIAHAG